MTASSRDPAFDQSPGTVPKRLPNKAHWPETLADHDTLWCVFCLRRIDDDTSGCNLDYPLGTLEIHHPFPQSVFGKKIKRPLLPASFPLGWTVPAHAPCHEAHYPDAWGVADNLLGKLAVNDRQLRDNWAREFHEMGLYWHALAMNADTLRRFSRELRPEERATLLERQLSSASGVRSRVHPFPERNIYDAVPREHRSRVLYHLVNRQANRGHQKAAHATYERAQAFRSFVRGEAADRIELSSLLRRAQVDRTLRTGDKALKAAADALGTSSYSYLTACLLRGWNALAEERQEACDSFDEVLKNANWASWLYIGEALFGKTCCSLMWESCKKDRIYQWLVQAQYIYVMMGLQVTPHTRLPAKLQVPADVSCFPGHILVSGRFADLSAERRTVLRQIAIGVEGESDWLYRALQDTLCGRSGSRARVEFLRDLL